MIEMVDCRYYPWCMHIGENGCAKDQCCSYQQMPDTDALLGLANELENRAKFSETAPSVWLGIAAENIRKAVGA